MIYLASPYTHPDQDVMDKRYDQVAGYCATYAEQHLVIYSPIAHWHPIAKQFKLPREAQYWRFHNREMIQLCRELWVLGLAGWKISVGIEEDRQFAKVYHKEVKIIHVSR